MKKATITKRQFFILKHLDETVDWVNSREIGKYIGCSYKTIQKEVRNIQQYLPESWILLSKKGFGMKVIRPSDETVDSIFMHDHKELNYQLINLLVDKKGYSIERISELLYINRNKTVQLIKQVRQMIKPFFLILKRRPYHVEGNECGIRLLLFEVVYSQKGYSYFQSVKKYQNIYIKLKMYLEEAHGITLTNHGINTFFIFLNISSLRSQKGFKPDELPFGVGEKLIDQGYFKEFSDFFILLEELLACKIQVEERMYIYLALIYSEWEYIPSLEVALTNYSGIDIVQALEMLTTDKNVQHLYVPKNECMEFLEFLYFLKENLGYDFFNDKSIIIKIFNLYCISKVRSVLPMFQYSPKGFVLKNIANEYPELLKEISCIFKKWEENKNFKFDKSIIMSFAILIAEYLTADKQQQPNILFLTSRSQIIGDYTLNNLKRHFNGKVNLKKKCVWELYESNIKLENIDLIITDTVLALPLKNIQVILIENIFSNKELLDIDYAIDLCMKRKGSGANNLKYFKKDA